MPRPPLWQRIRIWVAAIAVLALLAWSWTPAEMFKFLQLGANWQNMVSLGSEFLKPNLDNWRLFFGEMIVTAQIAIWGTALAVAFGVPMAILSSSNIVPQWVVQPVRRLMDLCRSIDIIVFALIFVAAVGLGPFAGVLAIFINNLGIVSKLFSEAVEAIDPRPVEGIRATGASRLQEVIFGIVPQVIPIWSSLTLYRFESNLRSATVLGVIGAGGIGQSLYENIRAFRYDEAATIIIIIALFVMTADILSARLRKFLV